MPPTTGTNPWQKEKIERSLQESEDRYRSVVDSLNEGIILQSREGIVLACNPSAERILHTPPGGLVGVRRGSYFKRVIMEHGTVISVGDLPSPRVFTSGEPLLGLVLAIGFDHADAVWISENVLPICRPGEIVPESILISFSDMSAVKDAKQRLQYMAMRGSLTGLSNRALLA
ncbi:MAG: PAS domain-containing protein [Herminiimonas sp.]|nr:PAS domain-containing protein [Herminiimonas sp.]